MTIQRWTCAALLSLAACGAHAELIDRGGGLIYDTDRDITWLRDWNYAQTSGYAQADGLGRMNWSAANSWASQLVFQGYDDWRLPSGLNPDGTRCTTVLGCTESEMGHIWYTELGNTTGLASSGPFTSMQQGNYWSGTFIPGGIENGSGVIFGLVQGDQFLVGQNALFFAVAVRNGDSTPAVPEPGVGALMLLGGVTLGLTVRKRRRPLAA